MKPNPAILLSGLLLLGAMLRFAHAAGVEERTAVVISEGVRLQATIYTPEAAKPPLPTLRCQTGLKSFFSAMSANS